MRLLLLTRYEQLGSSSRVRFYQYLPYLKAHGVEVVRAPFFNDNYVKALYSGGRPSFSEVFFAYVQRVFALIRSTSYDVLWVEKELFPWLPAGFEALLNRLKIPYVVDYDDAVFHRYDMHRSFLIRTLLGRKIDRVMRHARLVIAGNEYLAHRARTAGARRVELLPSVVDVDQYVVSQPSPDAVFRVGWIGSPVTAPYLESVREPLEQLNRELKVKLVLIGAGKVQPVSDIPTELLPWSEDIELKVSELFDVGIMPLVDGPFERGKCGYKLIQYMAGALPVIASPVGVNQQIVEPGINGFLAASAADWLTALQTLGDDVQKRRTMGQAGRQKAEQLYNLRTTAPQLLTFLSSLTKT